MKRAAFKQPPQASAAADEWVKGEGAEIPTKPPSPPAGEMTRLTIDLPADLHYRFKVTCAMHRTKMVEEVRRFIEDWVQKHGKL
jgi:ParG